MDPPIQPTDYDCCNSGCNPCVFDVYEKKLKLYKNFKVGENTRNITENGITDLEYTMFTLLDVLQISNKHKILSFKMVQHSNMNVWWNPGDHFLIKYTSPSKVSCTRAYTPVKVKLNIISSLGYDFFIVVKKYDNGIVSNYLFDLTVGAETLWRGPYGSYKVEQNKYTRIVMIAQGTGIAPFYSIIQNTLSNEEDMTRIVLYYCCKEVEEIIFRDELYEFQSYWNFLYKIYVSNTSNDNWTNIKYNEPIINYKLNIREIENLNSHCTDQYLLCGSIQFMEQYENIIRNGNYADITLF